MEWDVAKVWNPPADWLRITTVDAHAAGEPLRVVTGGYPDLPGNTILERRRYVAQRLDHLRKALMWEPRGHADMYGCILTPAITPGADFGVLFIHNEGYSTMCGHGIIGVVTVAIEIGLVAASEPETIVRIDTPAGLVTATAAVLGGRVLSVRFRNVPSFVVELDAEVDVLGMGRVKYDLAFGGAFYAFVDSSQIGVACSPESCSRLIDAGMAIKRAVADNRPVDHPFERDLSFLYGTIFIGPPELPGSHSRNVCVFAEGEVDRSPTGTGVSGRLAVHYARGEIESGEEVLIESLIGTRFTGRVVQEVRFGPYAAIIPEVEGTAFITGRHEFLVDPSDEIPEGFLLR